MPAWCYEVRGFSRAGVFVMAKSTSGVIPRFKGLGAILVVSSLLGAIGVTVGAPSASAGSCVPAPKANLTGCNFAGENLSGRNLTRQPHPGQVHRDQSRSRLP